MKKKIISSLMLCLLAMGQTQASDVLTVEAVTVPQGSEAILKVDCEFETQFKAFQLDIELPDGLALAVNDGGKPVCELGFEGTDHAVSSSVVATGKYRFVCTSNSNTLLPMSGTLLKVSVTGGAALAVGDSFEGKVTNTEFTAVNYDVTNLDDVSFTVTIGEAPDTRLLLDEEATEAPQAATGVDVRVKRSLAAGVWNTICLPFSMTAEQTAEAFGSDVQIGDFDGIESTVSGDDVTDIKVKFVTVASIEANHPYLLKVSADKEEFSVDNVDIVVEDEPSVDKDPYTVGKGKTAVTFYNRFVGTYVAGTAVPEETLYMNDDRLYYSDGSTTMKAFRAYFDFYDILVDTGDEYAEAHFTLLLDNSVITGVNMVGDLRQSDGRSYDLGGRRLSRPAKGISIVGGRKHVVK